MGEGASMEEQENLTELLEAAFSGDRGAENELLQQVYAEMKQLARNELRRERPGGVQVTTLVHETYLRLVNDSQRSAWSKDRRYFFGAAAHAMRRYLVDEYRRRGRLKRGGAFRHRNLDGLEIPAFESDIDLVALDEALDRLDREDPRARKVVECRYFMGFSVEDTAKVLSVSCRTVHLDWVTARRWLQRALRQ